MGGEQMMGRKVVRKLKIVSVTGVLAQGAEGAEKGVRGAAPSELDLVAADAAPVVESHRR